MRLAQNHSFLCTKEQFHPPLLLTPGCGRLDFLLALQSWAFLLPVVFREGWEGDPRCRVRCEWWHQGDNLSRPSWGRAGGRVGVVFSQHTILCSWELHDSNWSFWGESDQARPWFRALECPWEMQPVFILVSMSKEGEY